MLTLNTMRHALAGVATTTRRQALAGQFAALLCLLTGCSSNAPAGSASSGSVLADSVSADKASAESTSAESASLETVAATAPLTVSQQQQQQTAKVAMHEHRYADALAQLQTLPDADSTYMAAVAYYRLNQLDNAGKHLDRILQGDGKAPSSSPASSPPASVDSKRAAQMAPQALAKAQDATATIQAGALNLRGLIAKQQGLFRQAERDFLAAIASQPNFAPPQRNLGILYELFLANPAQAALHYQRYVELTHDSTVQRWLDALPSVSERAVTPSAVTPSVVTPSAETPNDLSPSAGSTGSTARSQSAPSASAPSVSTSSEAQ